MNIVSRSVVSDSFVTLWTVVCVLSHFSHVLFFATPWTVAGQAALFTGSCRQKYQNGLPCPPQGIFLTCVSHRTCVSCLLHWQAGSLPLAQPGKPMDSYPEPFFQVKILEWLAIPFSRGSSRPRAQILVSYIAGRFFTI